MAIFNVFARLAGRLAPLTRGVTLGVRGACIDEEGRFLLVRHSYTPGWYLPGGGVERRETAIEALERELLEETGIRLEAPAALFSIYLNRRGLRDHVVLFVVRRFSLPAAPPYPNREIAEVGFFGPSDLPEATSPATRRRIAEIVAASSADPHW